MLKNFFSYKLMVTAFSLYAISAYERFHRNAQLSDSRENLYWKSEWKQKNTEEVTCLNLIQL